jgi:hypothetical protein
MSPAPRVVVQPWQLSLLDGYSVGVRAVRRAVHMARHMRQFRPYAWRAISAWHLTEARLIRQHLAAGMVGEALLDRLISEQSCDCAGMRENPHTKSQCTDGFSPDDVADLIEHDLAAHAAVFGDHGPDVRVFRL